MITTSREVCAAPARPGSFLFCAVLSALLMLGLVLNCACSRLPFVPDDTAGLLLEANPEVITCGESCTVVVTGIKASGYPLPDGTRVYLSASDGTIATSVDLEDGRAVTTYQSRVEYAGEVEITARSGQAAVSPDPLIVTVAEVAIADIEYLYIRAEPADLPPGGGKAAITVQALDEEMKPVAGKNIWMESDAGSLTGGPLYVSDENGRAVCDLKTTITATVTARYKSVSSDVTVSVAESTARAR